METITGILYYLLTNSGEGGINKNANLRKRPAENLNINGRIILKLILRK